MRSSEKTSNRISAYITDPLYCLRATMDRVLPVPLPNYSNISVQGLMDHPNLTKAFTYPSWIFVSGHICTSYISCPYVQMERMDPILSLLTGITTVPHSYTSVRVKKSIDQRGINFGHLPYREIRFQKCNK